MDYIRIDRTRMMVSFSPEDMERFGIGGNAEQGTVGFEEMRVILTKIEENTGFGVRNDKLEIRLFLSNNGGCEMYLFKTPYAKNGSRIRYLRNHGKAVKSSGIRRRVYKIKTERKNSSETLFFANDYHVYRFDCLNDVMDLCALLNIRIHRGKSELYRIVTNGCDDSARYFLAVDFELFYANEYNGILLPQKSYYFVKEHGYLIYSSPIS